MIAGELLLNVEHHLLQGDALFIAFAGIEQAGQIIKGPKARSRIGQIQVNMSNGNLAATTHLGQKLEKVHQGQRLACARLAPDRQMAGMVVSEDRSEMTAELFDFCVSNAGVENLVEDVQLFGLDELLVFEITSVLDHS